MKTKSDPISKKDTKKRRIKKSVIISFGVITLCTFFIGYGAKALYRENVYKNLDIDFKEVKEIEYGTANYDAMSLVKAVSDGEITNYTKDVDTLKVGSQELEFEITKGNVVKKVKVKIEVKDSNSPDVALKSDAVTITQGQEFDLNANVESVKDVVDGDIPYTDIENENAGYTISGNLDVNTPGEYDVTVKAKDLNGNVSESGYKVNVEAPAPSVNAEVQKNQNVVYSNAPATVDTSSVVSAAYSLIGSKYSYGGSNPETGFDCSGFVQYIYGAIGKNISRSSGTQLNDGFAVSRENMQPGDIIIWSTQSNDVPTHSSVYVGDNTIVHAINSSRGVQESDLSSWETYGGHIVGIRRV